MVIVKTNYCEVRLLPWECHAGTLQCKLKNDVEVSQQALIEKSRLIVILNDTLHHAFDPWLVDVRMRGWDIIIPFHHRSRRLFGRSIAAPIEREATEFMPGLVVYDEYCFSPREVCVLAEMLVAELKYVVLERWERFKFEDVKIFATAHGESSRSSLF